MTFTDDENLNTLAAINAGRLDALSPDQVARLEAFLNAAGDAADLIADQRPTAVPALRLSAPPPKPTDWVRVWGGIEAGLGLVREPAALKLRFWRPMLAAAAVCALLVGVWSLHRATSVPEWPVAWAKHIEIDELEVSEGATPLILGTESDRSIPIIWVLEGGG